MDWTSIGLEKLTFFKKDLIMCIFELKYISWKKKKKFVFKQLNLILMNHFPLILGVYTRETKEVFEFISKLISQAKRKCK